jgi:hypothetical protein
MLDEILEQIANTTATSMEAMVARYAHRVSDLRYVRADTYHLLGGGVYRYNHDANAAQQALINRCRDLRSFQAYVVYDSAQYFVLTALLALHAKPFIAPDVYNGLSEPWRYQVEYAQ